MDKEWKSVFAVIFVMATSLSGCLNEDSSDVSPIVVEAGLPDGFFVTAVSYTHLRAHET